MPCSAELLRLLLSIRIRSGDHVLDLAEDRLDCETWCLASVRTSGFAGARQLGLSSSGPQGILLAQVLGCFAHDLHQGLDLHGPAELRLANFLHLTCGSVQGLLPGDLWLVRKLRPALDEDPLMQTPGCPCRVRMIPV